ncbi:LysR family transcriptional regulator [Dyella subtropica]|uniref:LysR family transcriptional regulator n=1 Tax=Dyella subtropica TaxID=2992127 RepID=UPI00225AA074|nr:LysR family transcriptional regulator [Dyella subtropica]
MQRDLPPLNALRAFEATARLESVSQAAQELHVTHGAVSRQIRVLEDDLGSALFRRQGRGLVLTPAGQRLRDASAAAFAQLRDACEQLRGHAAQTPFVLGCPVSLLTRWMIPRLERLMAELPELNLHLRPQEIPFDEALTGLDAALLAAAPPWPAGWHVFPLARERIGPVLSPRFAQTHGLLHSDPSAVLGQRLLHTASRPHAWQSWMESQHLPMEKLHFSQSYPHLYHLIEAAVAGLGVAIAPAQMVADDLASGRLLAPWGFQDTAAQWVLAVPSRAPTSRLMPLATWLEAEFTAHEKLPAANGQR